MPRVVKCSVCRGTGFLRDKGKRRRRRCPNCKGSGIIGVLRCLK